MSIPRFDLNLLLTLDAVLTERSVAAAAKRLNVTASAVSNALARLRIELNDPLLVRNGRGVVPTPRALALAPVLRVALQELEGSLRYRAFDPKSSTRRFTLGMADAGQITQLPGLARLMAAEMPHASLRVIGIDTFLSLGGAASTEVDVAIARAGENAPGVHVVPAYKEIGVLVVRRNHWIHRKKLSKSELALLRHVDVQVAPGRGYTDLDQSYAQLGIQRDIAMTVPNFTAAAAVAAETDWAATLPAGLVKKLEPQFDLVTIGKPAPAPHTRLSLVWHDRTHLDPANQAFRALIGDYLATAQTITEQEPRGQSFST